MNNIQIIDTMKRINILLNIKTVLALAITLSIFTSCNDWIDIEPENALIQQEFWKTKDDVMAVLAATYESTRSNTEKSFLMGEIRADFVNVKESGSVTYYAIGVNKISSTLSPVSWANYYRTINLANTVMFYAPRVQGADKTLNNELLNEINAEMIFIRSLNYFYLVRIWKDVPLVTSATVSDTVNFFLPKSPEYVVLNRLVKDLKKASGLASKDASEKGRANKYAIQALLADILLWKEDYSQCVTYCDSLINTGVFALETSTNWFKNFYPGNSPSESIFEIQFDDSYEGQENYFSEQGYWGAFNVNTAQVGYDKETDIRYCQGKGPSWKYLGKDETGSNQQRRTGSERSSNFIYYRYADVLLMKAEAMAELGNFASANALVKQVTERAGTSYNDINSLKAFRTRLLAERGREFAAEGKRWFDVLRFAKKDGFNDKQFIMDMMLEKANDAQELAVMRGKVIDTMSYYLPIYEDELLYNKKLVQNPFYDR